MSYSSRLFNHIGELPDNDFGTSISYEAHAVRLSGGLIQITGWCGPSSEDAAEFSFVYVPETQDVIIYSIYKLEYINNTDMRLACCANIAFSNPYYFGDIGEMCSMAPCVRTCLSRKTVFLRPLVKSILGENPLHQLTLPIERFAYYRRA